MSQSSGEDTVKEAGAAAKDVTAKDSGGSSYAFAIERSSFQVKAFDARAVAEFKATAALASSRLLQP